MKKKRVGEISSRLTIAVRPKQPARVVSRQTLGVVHAAGLVDEERAGGTAGVVESVGTQTLLVSRVRALRHQRRRQRPGNMPTLRPTLHRALFALLLQIRRNHVFTPRRRVGRSKVDQVDVLASRTAAGLPGCLGRGDWHFSTDSSVVTVHLSVEVTSFEFGIIG